MPNTTNDMPDAGLELLKIQHGNNPRLLSSLLNRAKPLTNIPDGSMKSCEVMIRNRQRQRDFYKAGNPFALDPVNPPAPGSAEDKELDDDLFAMGIGSADAPDPLSSTPVAVSNDKCRVNARNSTNALPPVEMDDVANPTRPESNFLPRDTEMLGEELPKSNCRDGSDSDRKFSEKKSTSRSKAWKKKNQLEKARAAKKAKAAEKVKAANSVEKEEVVASRETEPKQNPHVTPAPLPVPRMIGQKKKVTRSQKKLDEENVTKVAEVPAEVSARNTTRASSRAHIMQDAVDLFQESIRKPDEVTDAETARKPSQHRSADRVVQKFAEHIVGDHPQEKAEDNIQWSVVGEDEVPNLVLTPPQTRRRAATDIEDTTPALALEPEITLDNPITYSGLESPVSNKRSVHQAENPDQEVSASKKSRVSPTHSPDAALSPKEDPPQDTPSTAPSTVGDMEGLSIQTYTLRNYPHPETGNTELLFQRGLKTNKRDDTVDTTAFGNVNKKAYKFEPIVGDNNLTLTHPLPIFRVSIPSPELLTVSYTVDGKEGVHYETVSRKPADQINWDDEKHVDALNTELSLWLCLHGCHKSLPLTEKARWTRMEEDGLWSSVEQGHEGEALFREHNAKWAGRVIHAELDGVWTDTTVPFRSEEAVEERVRKLRMGYFTEYGVAKGLEE